MEKCFDEGTLQAFLDNELEESRSLLVANHVAACDSCAELLAVVEEETSFVMTALEPEINALVPTQRLWTKISGAIDGERGIGLFGSVRRWFAHLSMPTMAAFASLVIVAGTFAFFMTADPGSPSLALGIRSAEIRVDSVRRPAIVDQVVEPVNSTESEPRVIRADFSRREPARPAPDFAATPRTIDGEANYIKTISGLERSVDRNKDALLSPAARFAYEKDLAVIDDAIRRTRRDVRANPRNQLARQVLFSSYQNKIDLLRSVSERGELMASLGR